MRSIFNRVMAITAKAEDKALADKALADKALADKALADKALADKAATENTTGDAIAEMQLRRMIRIQRKTLSQRMTIIQLCTRMLVVALYSRLVY
jgi:hypothetical protein